MANNRAAPPPARQPWPSLPNWPPLPANGPVAPGPAREETFDEFDSTVSEAMPEAMPTPGTEQQPAPHWGQPYPGVPDLPYEPPHTLWQRLRSSPRRLLIGLAAAVVTVVLLCSLLGVVVFANFLGPLPSTAGGVTPGAGHTSGPNSGQSGQPDQTALPTTTDPNATPSITTFPTATPALPTATPMPPFTLTFTCASGAVGGTGEVCIHTQPNATVSLTVRYCDGSFAEGKGVHGTAHTDGSGNYTWRWNVTTHCVGTATATVTAKSGGQTLTQNTTFNITG